MRMTEPLPNWRSIWVRAPCRAVSLAFAGSWILMPSTLGRGPDRRQHANVTKACRVCANCVQTLRGPGQREPERRPRALHALEPHGAAVGLHDLVRQGQPEPRAPPPP